MFYLLNLSAQSSGFEKAFKKQYHESLQFIKENQTLFEKYLVVDNLSWKGCAAIVFPEIVRYSDIKNFIEVKTLELLYVNGGESYANFSIGRFQMKPSFIETLEKQLEKYKYPTKNIFNYKYKDIKEERKERIKRLSNLTWQLLYLKAFCWVVQKIFAHKKFNNETERVRFYAAAYNFGFLQSEQKITNWQSSKSFPYGKIQPKEKQFIYAEIAVDYFEKK
ncbi:MAG: hypothetical protein EAZ85_00245 [Bacteroidetes bacterium]|nr:MAG: hypothetical protein EAZ85_00245 [Bacteroidota bacterium]